MRIHFIAIGGAAMHNLAIALAKKGHKVTGSDDEIFEPSRSRLDKHGLLPKKTGWYPEQINPGIDCVILGMHARKDNPELQQAQKQGIKIYSYPEFLYEQTKNKERIVIGGSHGKTTTTSIIMHVLKESGRKFDYMVGSNIEGFDTMVNLEENNDLAVFEGDEYLSSPIDMRPKFHLYYPHIAVITGIAWDHINVFPTFENYVEQFSIFVEKIQAGGSLIAFSGDTHVRQICENAKNNMEIEYYQAHDSEISNGITYLLHNHNKTPLKIFGKHNLENIQAAYKVCKTLGIKDSEFYGAIKTFSGAGKRLQNVYETKTSAVYLDFAHSPSKLQATINSVKNQFPNRKLTAVMELHTYSSLNIDFLSEYKDTMRRADTAVVYFNELSFKHKRLEAFTSNDVKKAFNNPSIVVITEKNELYNFLVSQSLIHENLLLMSSGNFSGLDLHAISKQIC